MAGGDKCALGHALLIAEGLKEGVCLGSEGKLLLVFPQSQLVKDSLAGLSMGGGMDSCLIEPRISDQKFRITRPYRQQMPVTPKGREVSRNIHLIEIRPMGLSVALLPLGAALRGR